MKGLDVLNTTQKTLSLSHVPVWGGYLEKMLNRVRQYGQHFPSAQQTGQMLTNADKGGKGGQPNANKC